MVKNKKEKIILIVALIIAIMCLTVGFAAFSKSLLIESTVTVSPSSENFKVVFSSNLLNLETNPILATTTGGASGENAIINNNGNPTISNLKVNFTAPGQSVTYKFFVRNEGAYLAHLTSVVFDNAYAGYGNEFKICTSDGATNSLVEDACNGIKVTLTLDNKEYTTTMMGISDSVLEINESKEVTVKIEYLSTSPAVDGNMLIDLGNIYLTYGTTKTSEPPVLPNDYLFKLSISDLISEESSTVGKYNITVFVDVLNIDQLNRFTTNNSFCLKSYGIYYSTSEDNLSLFLNGDYSLLESKKVAQSIYETASEGECLSNMYETYSVKYNNVAEGKVRAYTAYVTYELDNNLITDYGNIKSIIAG